MIPRLAILLAFCLLAPYAARATDSCAGHSEFLVGAGVYDVTGPAGDAVMMGYAMPWQTTGGIHTRLWARAFVIASPCNGKRLAFVSVDVGLLTQAVKHRVVERLQADLGTAYGDDNVILSATHTHSGPGGYSHYTLYNLTTLGYNAQNFAAVTEGISAAIERADANVVPATIRLAGGELICTSGNRSKPAYAENPAEERARYAHDTDKHMTVLRFDAVGGGELGMISWFPVHATSMNNHNHLISGDNKGYAAYRFERGKGTDYGAARTFVAAFAQSHEGDVSPNFADDGCPTDSGCAGDQGCPYDGGDTERTRRAGEKQLALAQRLYDTTDSRLLTGGVDYRHAYVKMDAVTVAPEFADGAPHATCPAAIGFSMPAGTEDGRGVGYEGLSCRAPANAYERLVCAATATDCQGAKPIVLQMGTKWPEPWSPEVLPLQVARIGSLGIVAVPFELTTMSGRRVLDDVRALLAPRGVVDVVIAGLSNAYAGYVTTPEEYAAQHYEGGSTHFGPWTLGAVRQEVSRLAAALRDATPVDPGPTPHDPSDAPWTVQTGVPFDGVPLDESFGSVQRDAASSYRPGQTVAVSFWGGHPQNDLRTQDTFLRVQRLVGDGWETVARDWDWETVYRWERNRCFPSLMCSLVTIEWTIPEDEPPGTYRIRHDGNWKAAQTGAITAYVGYSRAFAVERTP